MAKYFFRMLNGTEIYVIANSLEEAQHILDTMGISLNKVRYDRTEVANG